MPPSNVDLSHSSCPSLDSNQNLQKLKEIFFREATNYKQSLQKFFSDSQVALNDGPIKSEFFTYYTADPNTFLPKSDEQKASDTQSKLTEFLKNCIFSNHFFGNKNEPKTKNKACMCKPVRKRSNTNLEPINGRRNVESTVDRNTGGIYDIYYSRKESIDEETEAVPVKINEEQEEKRKKVKDNDNQTNWRKRLIGSSKKDTVENVPEVNEKKIDAKTNIDATPAANGKKPKIILNLPIDLSQFYRESTDNQLKVILCDNKTQQCRCNFCGSSDVHQRDRYLAEKHSRGLLTKESDDEFQQPKSKSKLKGKFRKKERNKRKRINTEKHFVDEETSVDEENLQQFKEKKKKKSFLDYCKCFNRKTKNKRSQANLSEGVDKNVGTNGKHETKTKTFEKCCRCNKYDAYCPMSGDQVDTLKLLIKMEAKQNYRQINNIIKELNDQQDDIRKLREIYARIAEHFPKILGGNNANGDNFSNIELQQNIRKLFEMYKDLSHKINEIYRLSEDIVKRNSILSNAKTESDYTSHNKSTSDQMSQDSKLTKTGDSSKKTSYEDNLGGVKKTAGVAVTNGLNYDELPEKLPKSEMTPKKTNCPCELNLGLYLSNSGK